MYSHFKKRDARLASLGRVLQNAGVRTRRSLLDDNLGVGKPGGKAYTGTVDAVLDSASLLWRYKVVLSKRDHGVVDQAEAVRLILHWAFPHG